MSTVIDRDTLPGGKHWSFVLRRGVMLRLTDLDGGANVGLLFYNPANLLERYNAPDTLKCQHTFRLTLGHCLYSDMGRIFCSIVEDTAGWHDTVCGSSTKALVAERWGTANYQTHRNDWQQNGRDSFLVEGGKYGLGRRDLAANVNCFSKVVADDAGGLTFVPSEEAGRRIALRFEMDTLVLLHTCPHPLDPSPTYPRKPVAFEVSQDEKALDETRFAARGENGRGHANTRIYNACGGNAC